MQSPGFGEPKESLEPLWKLKSQLHCSDLGLFISSFVKKKKDKKSSALIHVNLNFQ